VGPQLILFHGISSEQRAWFSSVQFSSDADCINPGLEARVAQPITGRVLTEKNEPTSCSLLIDLGVSLEFPEKNPVYSIVGGTALKLALKRPASQSRSANQKPPDAHGKNSQLTGQTHANNEVGSRF